MDCKTCNKQGAFNGTLSQCTNCWEVERRIEDYLKSKKGLQFIIAALRQRKDENGNTRTKTSNNQRSRRTCG